MPNSISVAVRDKLGIWSRRVTIALEPGDTLATLANKAWASKRSAPPGTPEVQILVDGDGYYSPQFRFADGTYLRDPQSIGSALADDRMIEAPWWRVWMRRVFWWLCMSCALTWAWYLIQSYLGGVR